MRYDVDIAKVEMHNGTFLGRHPCPVLQPPPSPPAVQDLDHQNNQSRHDAAAEVRSGVFGQFGAVGNRQNGNRLR